MCITYKAIVTENKVDQSNTVYKVMQRDLFQIKRNLY